MKYATDTVLDKLECEQREKTTLFYKEFQTVSELENHAWQLSRHDSVISVSLMRPSLA